MGTLTRTRTSGRVGLIWEQYHPSVLGLVAACGYAYGGAAIMQYMIAEKWEIGSIYSSIFDIASIFTAFLFTFYTLVVTTDRGFIGRMKNTNSYALLKSYATSALILGTITVGVTVPFTVVEPKPVAQSDVGHYLVALWVGISVWTILAFVRAARLFVAFISQHD